MVFEKDPVGLAVEVFCAMVNDGTEPGPDNAMATSIRLVKQAQKAFE